MDSAPDQNLRCREPSNLWFAKPPGDADASYNVRITALEGHALFCKIKDLKKQSGAIAISAPTELAQRRMWKNFKNTPVEGLVGNNTAFQ